MSTNRDPNRLKQFAISIVEELRKAGYQALWAGGCVRDQLLKKQPKDYDVATDATPEQVRQVFHKRKTLPIGAQFGVIAILGPNGLSPIEVATFRKDVSYSDGRRPDAIEFCSAEHDAQRRDFTINGLFYDPISEKVIDYVHGVDDLKQGIIRAIGDPHQRINEDKLRMLRAIRFSTTLGFEIDATTFAAIENHAHQIQIVSVERITTELTKILSHPQRTVGLELLVSAKLFTEILPQLTPLLNSSDAWSLSISILKKIYLFDSNAFCLSLAALYYGLQLLKPIEKKDIQTHCQTLKLSNRQTELVQFLCEHVKQILSAKQQPWPTLQPILIHQDIHFLLVFSQAVAGALGHQSQEIEFCQKKLALPQNQLNPAPLITGNDLHTLGIPSGNIFSKLLKQVRQAQLNQVVTDRSAALEYANRLWKAESPK